MKLTKRQQEVLDYLKDVHSKWGTIPSTREIQEHFEFASQTAAVSHLKALEKKGAIIKIPSDKRRARGYAIAEHMDRPPLVDVPIYGAIPAGYADDTLPETEGQLSVDIQSLGVRPTSRAFALRVRGDSMIDAHILDGDHVVLENREPRNQDVVAALIDGETTLKRYILDRRRPFLKAENPKYPDLLPVNELVIQGVMVGLVRGAVRNW